jgi:GNAT superfamily N-acetyltransferase
MVQLTSRERVDAFWSSTLGVEPAEFRTPGISVFLNPPQRASWRGIYVLAFDKGASVFTPADLLEPVTAALATHDVESVLAPATWQSGDVAGRGGKESGEVAGRSTGASVLDGGLISVVGPMIHHYRDHPDGLKEVAAGRRVNPGDAEALADIRTAVPPDEWAAAGFNAQPAVMFGLFEDERMMAAANLTPGPDAATDIGLVIHPDARGKGYGVQIAATAARQALLMHGIARFRVAATSQSTLAIASTLGFEEYGRNLAIYLTPGPPPR